MVGPQYTLDDNVRQHCFQWAQELLYKRGKKDGSIEQAAMGRFGECCVATHVAKIGLEVCEGPKFKHDLVVQSPRFGGTRRLEVKTKIEKHAPPLSFRVFVRYDQYHRQQNDTDIYVFVACYPDDNKTTGEIIGFELAENIAFWELLKEGDTLESGYEIRYSAYRTKIDNLKPISALPEYLYYVNNQSRLSGWHD